MSSWKQELSRSLSQHNVRPRLAVVGVGQPLRGDDGAGARVARQLAMRVHDPALLVVAAEHAPENCLGLIEHFRPDVVLFVDAARAGGAPGDLLWLPVDEADGLGGSTHTLPLATLGAYLKAQTGAAIYVLGIEPAGTALGDSLSKPVAHAVAEVVRALEDHWRSAATTCSAIMPGGVSVESV